jgi:hypothetical protein
MFRTMLITALTVAAVVFCPNPARAVLSSPDNSPEARIRGSDLLQAREYRMPETYVPGQESIRQSMTVWEVTGGTWNGQHLEGLSVVLVNRIADNDSGATTTRCYISHLASAAQRDALLDAFVTSRSVSPGESASWRPEVAVIRIEHLGGVVIVHLGLVA